NLLVYALSPSVKEQTRPTSPGFVIFILNHLIPQRDIFNLRLVIFLHMINKLFFCSLRHPALIFAGKMLK
ncbi:hypothetical protein D7004_01975, partial [Pedobacter jejuensis]